MLPLLFKRANNKWQTANIGNLIIVYKISPFSDFGTCTSIEYNLVPDSTNWAVQRREHKPTGEATIVLGMLKQILRTILKILRVYVVRRLKSGTRTLNSGVVSVSALASCLFYFSIYESKTALSDSPLFSWVRSRDLNASSIYLILIRGSTTSSATTPDSDLRC